MQASPANLVDAGVFYVATEYLSAEGAFIGTFNGVPPTPPNCFGLVNDQIGFGK